LIRSFDASARAFGRVTTKGDGWTNGYIGPGSYREYRSVVAQCEEGTLRMEVLTYARMRLACPKPATRAQCESLLRQISATPRRRGW